MFGAVMFSLKSVVPENSESASIYNLWLAELAASTWPEAAKSPAI